MSDRIVPKYAASTQVSSEKSRYDIERLLTKYGATGFMYGWEGTQAVIMFKLQNRHVKMILTLPDRNDKRFLYTEVQRRKRKESEAAGAYEQAVRQKWRALLLIIKAKLEAVDSGITSLETEFMANIVLPDGQTVGNWIGPQIQTVYETGKMPLMIGVVE